jgi:hypothetical protein
MSGPARFAISGVALLALAVVAGIGGALLSDQPGPGAIAATAGLITVTMAAALGGGVWWWVRLDEAAREAHKWAWWWGGSVGMALGGVLLLTVMTHGDTVAISAWVGDTPGEAFGAGMVAILLFQLAGYTIAWALWWLRRR